MDEVNQFVLAGDIQPNREQSERDISAAVLAHQHYWIITAVHRASTEALVRSVADPNEPMLLDKENLIEVMAGCYICEEPFTTGIANLACPGDPHS